MDTTRLIAAALGAGVVLGPAHAALIDSTLGASPTATPIVTLDLPAAGIYAIDLSDLTSNAVQGDGSNVVIQLNTFAGARVVGVGWDVTLSVPSPGVLSDSLIGVVDGAGDGVVLNPGEGVSFPGSLSFASSPMIQPLGAMAFDAPGAVLVELHQAFGGPTASYLDESTLYIQIVPTPGAAATLGLGGLLAARRRRR